MELATLKYKERSQGAHKFTMWLFVASISMIFAGLTSAMLVRRSAGGAWTGADVGHVFALSTVFIIFSSVTMWVAHEANKKGNLKFTAFALFLTLVCGFLFCFFQFNGWMKLIGQGFYPSGNPNPAPQYLFVIVLVHVLHVVSGVVFLFLSSLKSLSLLNKKQLTITTDFKYMAVRTDLLSIYWHFIGILWLYLFGFLYFFM